MLGNWISETTATTGTGTISLGGAVSADLMAFSAQFVTGDMVHYEIKDGNNRENGYGILTSGTPWTLARTYIKSKWSGGTYTATPATGLTLSGSAVVSIDSDTSTENGDFMTGGGVASGQTMDIPDNWGTPASVSGQGFVAAGRANMIPATFDTARLYGTIAFVVSTLDAAATNTRFAIYKTIPSGIGSLIFDSGDLSALCSTTGAKTSALASKLLLTPGNYWFGLTSQSTVLKLYGMPNIYTSVSGGFSLVNPSVTRAGLYQNISISGAWPNPITQSGWTLQAGASPIFGFLP